MDVDDDDDDTDFGVSLPTAFDFKSFELAAIHECIQTISLPTHIERPPGNLGQSSHGKLGANEMLILFSIIFAIILPEIWFSHGRPIGEFGAELLDNFYHLVASTNIISSFSTSNTEADAYIFHYLEYRKSVARLFPNFHSRPNHHYAMHNDDLLKYWGPLASLSEFPGERLLGKFQCIHTNRHMCKRRQSFNNCL
jgi:hypothetical protein